MQLLLLILCIPLAYAAKGTLQVGVESTFNGRDVIYFTEPARFFEAYLNCRRNNKSLLTIRNGQEWDMIKKRIEKMGDPPPYGFIWVDGVQVGENHYVWLTSQLQIQNITWAPGEPNGENFKSPFLAVRVNGWADVAPDQVMTYFCEEPMVPIAPVIPIPYVV